MHREGAGLEPTFGALGVPPIGGGSGAGLRVHLRRRPAGITKVGVFGPMERSSGETRKRFLRAARPTTITVRFLPIVNNIFSFYFEGEDPHRASWIEFCSIKFFDLFCHCSKRAT